MEKAVGVGHDGGQATTFGGDTVGGDGPAVFFEEEAEFAGGGLGDALLPGVVAGALGAFRGDVEEVLAVEGGGVFSGDHLGYDRLRIIRRRGGCPAGEDCEGGQAEEGWKEDARTTWLGLAHCGLS